MTSVGLLAAGHRPGQHRPGPWSPGGVLYHERSPHEPDRGTWRRISARWRCRRIPASPQPFTMAEYFPTPGVTAFHDPRQHAVALRLRRTRSRVTANRQQDALELNWFTPDECRDRDAAGRDGRRPGRPAAAGSGPTLRLLTRPTATAQAVATTPSSAGVGQQGVLGQHPHRVAERAGALERHVALEAARRRRRCSTQRQRHGPDVGEPVVVVDRAVDRLDVDVLGAAGRSARPRPAGAARRRAAGRRRPGESTCSTVTPGQAASTPVRQCGQLRGRRRSRRPPAAAAAAAAGA